MTRILMVLEQGDRLPSGYIRGLVYKEFLASHGFSATFVSRQPLHLLDGLPYILRRVANVAPVRNRLMKWMIKASEHQILRLARNASIIYLSKVTSYSLLRRICQETNARIVYDFGDAIWLQEWDPNEFNEILRRVDAITTDNELTANYVRQFNPNCTVIPDAPQIEEFDKKRTKLGKKSSDRIILGWVGSPGTAYNLYVIWEALEELFQRYPQLHLRLVGTGQDLRLLPAFEKVQFSYRPFYTQIEMIEEVFGMHIGLFPLQNVERCRVRGVLKAAVYMSGEAAVVSSPVGQCPHLIHEGVNGMLANSTQEWIDKLEQLILDNDLRYRLAQNGLETVRTQFRLEQSFAKLKEVLLGEN
jgi:glycosyltransferase involved in cell wall biosynthesis